MPLEWMPREHELKNHLLFEEDMVRGRYWGNDEDAPCVVYTKKPLVNPKTGEEIPDLFVAEVRLNNPRQYNSYTTTILPRKDNRDRAISWPPPVPVHSKIFQPTFLDTPAFLQISLNSPLICLMSLSRELM